MNRIIQFRGKRKFDNEWIYGHYIKDAIELDRIYLNFIDETTYNTYFIVLPESAQQFTGLTDKNKTAIYEGDILKLYTGDHVVVEFKNGGFGFRSTIDKNHFTGFAGHTYFDYLMETFEVVGNIFDNPELILNKKQ